MPAPSKLHILFTSGWYPNRSHPTLGNFVQKHAEAVALFHNVSALSVNSDSSCKHDIDLEEKFIKGVYTVNVYYKKVHDNWPILSSIKKISLYIRAYRIGIAKIEALRGKPDLIHHNILYPSGFSALYMKFTRKIPYLITEHSTEYLRRKNSSSFHDFIKKKIAKNAKYITTVTEDLKNAMQNSGLQNRYAVIYNVANIQLFHPPSEKPKNERIRFLHISTLDDKHKNISGMLMAISKLASKRSDFEAFFIGDGDASPHILFAKSLGIFGSFVNFEGIKTTEEVAELMQSSDCFLLFSNYENLPCVIVEALATGIPVISTAVGGIAEHINSKNGALVNNNPEDLAITMDQMIAKIKAGDFKAEEICKSAQENFSYEKVGEKFSNLYYHILGH